MKIFLPNQPYLTFYETIDGIYDFLANLSVFILNGINRPGVNL